MSGENGAAEAAVEDNAPDNYWRAGADAIEEEDLSSGLTPDMADLLNQGILRDDHATQEPDAPVADETPSAEAQPEGEGLTSAEEPAPEAGSEEEPAADGEAPAEPAKAEAGDSPSEPVEGEAPKKIMVPKDRLDQEISRRRQLEEQLRAVQGQQGTDTPEQTVEKLEALDIDFGEDPKKMFDKILDGNLDEANDIFGQLIQKAATTAAKAGYTQARSEMEQVVNNVNDTRSEAQVIADFEDNYALFRPGDDGFNQDAVNDTVAMAKGFVAAGMSGAAAMQKAGDMTIKLMGAKADNYEAEAPAPTPAPAPAPAAEPPPAPRSPQDVDRNVQAQQQQPPSTQGRNNPPPPELPDITQLSQDELEALPEATLKRLRGDYL